MIPSIGKKIVKKIHRFCTGNARLEKEHEIKLRILIYISLLSFLFLSRTVRHYISYQDFLDARVFGPFLAWLLISIQPLVFKYTRNLAYCGLNIAFIGMVLIHIVSMKTGGIFSYSPYAYLLIVCVSFLLCGWKLGLFVWGLVSFEVINLAYGIIDFGLKLDPVVSKLDPLTHVIAIIVFSLLLGITIHAFEYQFIIAKKEATDKAIELERLYKEAKSLAKSKDDFLATMSHEFRTPLNGIIGNLDLLAQEKIESNLAEYVTPIRVCSENLLTVINDLLDYSRIQSGQTSLEFESFSPLEVYRDCIEILRGNPKFSKLEWKLSVGESENKSLVADPVRFRQLLLNLLSNSLKFTESGSISTHFEWCMGPNDNSQLRLTVQDTGIGIRKENLKGIFEPFNQADNTITRRFGGTGLGLALCKNIVIMHGGTIHVESKLGEGTKFKASFPLRKEIEANPKSQKKPHELDSSSPLHQVKALKVLVAEDDALNQRTLAKILAKFGIQADFANDGSEAFAKAIESKDYHLILMDIQMPVLDGISSSKKIKKYCRENNLLPPLIIALTANAMQGDQKECLDSGMDGYLSKPVRIKTIEGLFEQYFPDQ